MMNGIVRVLAPLQAAIDRISEWVGRVVAWLTLLMVAICLLLVIGRYFLDFGSIALQELVVYLHALVFMPGIAYTLKHDAHVRVDIIYQRLGERGRAWVDLCGGLLFLLPVAVFIGWMSLDYVIFSWRLRESSVEPGGLPGVFLLKSVILLMAAGLFAQGIGEIIRRIRRLADQSGAGPADRRAELP